MRYSYKHFLMITVFLFEINVFAANQDLTDWIINHSLKLDSIETLKKTPKLNDLDVILKNKQVLMLGEPDHYVSEKLEYQAALIERYYKLGFNLIGVEMGRSDARRINSFLQTGDESILNTIAIFGNLQETRIDRDLPSGLLAGDSPNDSKILAAKHDWVKANKLFWKKMRALNVARSPERLPLKVFGFDVDVIVGGAYQDIKKMIPLNSSNEIQQFLDLLTPSRTETRIEEVNKIKLAQDYLSTNKLKIIQSISPEVFEDITLSLKQLIESFAFIDMAYASPSAEQWLAIAAQREKTMMWQLDERLVKNQKIILIGHNDHLSKNSHTINLLRVESGNVFPTWYKVGTYLKEKLGEKLFGIWMLYGGGNRSTGPECSSPVCKILIDPKAINQTFLEASLKESLLFLNFSTQFQLHNELKVPVDYQFNGQAINSTVLPEQTDAILFIPEVHATGQL